MSVTQEVSPLYWFFCVDSSVDTDRANIPLFIFGSQCVLNRLRWVPKSTTDIQIILAISLHNFYSLLLWPKKICVLMMCTKRTTPSVIVWLCCDSHVKAPLESTIGRLIIWLMWRLQALCLNVLTWKRERETHWQKIMYSSQWNCYLWAIV